MTIVRRDIVSGSVLGAASLGLYLHVSTYPVREGQSAAISPGFYPQMLTLFLLTLAVIQIGTAVRNALKQRAQGLSSSSSQQMQPLWKDRRSLTLLLITLGALVLYPFVMRILGFTITGLLFLGTLITALSAGYRRGRNVLLIVGTTIAIGLLTYVVFRRFLNIPFPQGVLFRP